MRKVIFESNTRYTFKYFEIKQRIIKSLSKNLYLPILVRRKLLWQLDKLSLLSSLIYVKNRCVVSGRAKSIYKFFNLSRIVIKKFFRLGYIPGLNRSSW
uniref:7367d5f2-2873-41fe-b50a-d746f2b57841-CDS n=1 Tax=Plasmodiophora brassicae TaxID=37360 RepID=A0A3P3YW77_PLABS|nr:7367d5f2-2873-41fe-b50a-d746f2b57841-CDS [Plasmodiophora brassicae]